MNHLEFESKAIAKHGHRYDYSKAVVSNNRTKVEIVCKDHGVFLQAPDHHIRGRGCPSCAKTNRPKRRSIKADEFFEEASLLHEGFYDYSESLFTSMNDKVTIKCPVHGDFRTLARKHIQEKRGCPSCGRVRNQYAQSVFFQDFFDSAVDRHGYAYSYVDVSLKYMSDVIDVICREHGSFKVQASRHVHGVGCPKCRPTGSSPENEMAEFIESLGFSVVRNSRKIIPPLELDVVVNEAPIAFEFNGIFWHSEQNGKSSQYHQRKTLMSKRAGIRLFHVYESDWDLDQESIKERIATILNRPICPDLSSAYFLEEYSGVMSLISKGHRLCTYRLDGDCAVDYWSPYGLDPIRKLMQLSKTTYLKARLDWPEFSASDYVASGFKKAFYVRPERLFFDRKTLRRLKEKPEHCSGLGYFSVVDSGSAVWTLR